MKVAALAILTVLIAIPAEAVQRQNTFSPSCDNDGHCTTSNVTASTASQTPSLRARLIRASERKTRHVVDANGNSMLVTVQTAYGFNITVHPAYASKFLKFFALLKERGYKVPANITKCWAPHGTHVPARTITSVRLAIFRRAGIAGLSSSTTSTTSSHKLACSTAARSVTAVMSKRSVAHTTERPTFTPPWKNSNRNSRQQTISHERFQRDCDSWLRSKSDTANSKLSCAERSPENSLEQSSRPLLCDTHDAYLRR